MQRPTIAALLLLVLVGLTSWYARATLHRKVELFGHERWITTDPDSLYHVRRVARVLDEGLPVASFDERLNAPHGSAIPWPPYYTLVASAVVAPFAPEDPAQRREWLESSVASLACVFGVLASLAVALAAWRLAGPLAAMLAGLMHALSGIAVEYSRLGNGDHHAFVSLLAIALLATLARALEDDALDDPRRAARWGVAAGACAGVALGAWVASALYVVQAQLVLGALVVAHSRRPRRGVVALGLAFHLAALVVLAPALASSPWRQSTPWSVVNLSWFHAAHLALGAAVFAPLVALRTNSPLLRAWPWIVLAALLGCAALAFLADGALASALGESFTWLGRTDEFMARISESRRLTESGGELFAALGPGVLLLVPALAWMAWRSAAERSWPLALWWVATALLAAQTASQARFGEALAGPMAVVLAYSLRTACARISLNLRSPAPFSAFGVFAAVAIAQWPTIGKLVDAARSRRDAAHLERPAMLEARRACDWIATQPALVDGESVLAFWSYGHVIEWAAGRASVATNFGAYVGEQGFKAPARWFMSEDEAQAEAILDEHRVRYVLVDSDLPRALNSLIEYGAPERRSRYVPAGSERGGMVEPGWFQTLGARALFDGYIGPAGVDGRPFERLRIVWMGHRDPGRPLRSPKDFAPAASVWERVDGAVVEARGTSGEEFVLELVVAFPTADRQVRWRDAARADASGVARLRVPYSTDGRGGEARGRGPARWSLGSRAGSLEIRDEDVRAGRTLAVK